MAKHWTLAYWRRSLTCGDGSALPGVGPSSFYRTLAGRYLRPSRKHPLLLSGRDVSRPQRRRELRVMVNASALKKIPLMVLPFLLTACFMGVEAGEPPRPSGPDTLRVRIIHTHHAVRIGGSGA